MRRAPKPIPIERWDRPETCRIAWSAEPKTSAFTGNVKPDDKERALQTLHAAIRSDGYDPEACEIVWRMIDIGWGWVARVREAAVA
jgi:hypothetical protein